VDISTSMTLFPTLKSGVESLASSATRINPQVSCFTDHSILIRSETWVIRPCISSPAFAQGLIMPIFYSSIKF